MQCLSLQCSTVLCSTVQCSVCECSIVLFSAVRCSAVQYTVVWCSAVLCSGVQWSPIQCSAQWSSRKVFLSKVFSTFFKWRLLMFRFIVILFHIKRLFLTSQVAWTLPRPQWPNQAYKIILCKYQATGNFKISWHMCQPVQYVPNLPYVRSVPFTFSSLWASPSQ